MAKKGDSEKADTEQVNIRISAKLLDRLERIGEPLGIDRSHLIRQAILEYVQNHEQQPAKHQPRQ